MEIAIDAMESGAKQTLGEEEASLEAMRLWKLQQRRDVLGYEACLWKVPLML